MKTFASSLLAVSALVLSLTSRAEAGAWTLPKGQNWLKFGFMFQDTNERYFLDGERIPYFFDGRNQTRALFFEYARGLTDRWEVKAQLPFFSISFDDIAADRTSNDVGDLRVESRFNALLDPLVLTFGGEIKFPTGEFVNDAEIVPGGRGSTISTSLPRSAARSGPSGATSPGRSAIDGGRRTPRAASTSETSSFGRPRWATGRGPASTPSFSFEGCTARSRRASAFPSRP